MNITDLLTFIKKRKKKYLFNHTKYVYKEFRNFKNIQKKKCKNYLMN